MRKIIPVVVAGAAALAVAGGTIGYAATTKDVTVSVDGTDREVSTRAGTVGDVLAAQDLTVGPHDVVAPGLDASVADGQLISVRYGRQVTVAVDGKKKSFWTTARDVAGALQAVGLDSRGAALSTSRSAGIGREGLSFDLHTKKTVTVTAGGTTRKVSTTGLTVAAALKAAEVSVDGNDIVSRSTSSTLVSGAKVTVVKVEVTKVTRTKTVDHDTVRRDDSSLTEGRTKVQTEGVDGRRAVRWTITTHDGKTVKRTKTGSSLTRKPVTEVVLVGTKEPEPSAPSVASGSVWDQLAQCESGGNWAINTGNGFYGGLQFTLSTWAAYGGTGMPNQASRETQIAVATKVQASQGWGAWPACSSKLGLR